MTHFTEIILALFLLSDLALAAAGRLPQAIRLVAVQGFFLGILPLVLWDWTAAGCPPARLVAIVTVNTAVKGFVLPALLSYAVHKAHVERELEPLVSFRTSQIIVFLLAVASFLFCRRLDISEHVASELAIPVAFTTMGTGLFLVSARRKAITQVLGFLVFENGIASFGAGILLEYGTIVELGILLDVFVLVFVLGIAIFQINRTFSSIDTDRLNRLGDVHLLHPHHRRHA